MSSARTSYGRFFLPLLKFYSGKPLKLTACNPDLSQQASSEVNILACGCMFGTSLSEPAGTINDVLDLFMKGTAEPHMLQNDLENSLEGCSYVVILDSPLFHSILSGSVNILDAKAEPVNC